MLQEKAALHAERKTHGVDLDGVRFQRMVNAERAAVTRARARRDPRSDPPTIEPATMTERATSTRESGAFIDDGVDADAPLSATDEEARERDRGGDKRVEVLVRVRPLSSAERAARAVDVVTCVADASASSALVAVHEPRTKVDCTRHVESSLFELDGAFDARASDADVYAAAIEPLARLCLESACLESDDAAGANATVFAYGQTGSGKTHTMTRCTAALARDVCGGAREKNLRVGVSFYEVYAGKCFDLLADRARVRALEDARGRVRMVGLTERLAGEPHEVLALAEQGAACRKTSRTDANASSSRSHAVFQISLRAAEKSDALPEKKTRARSAERPADVPARLSLVDLAGSERGADRGKAVSERVRREGAEINTSLLALKECIRALSAEKSAVAEPPPGFSDGGAAARVPFRGSKLTTVLRDAFVGKRSRTVLLAHVSPGHDSAEHTVNTLRYATRLKEVAKAEPRREETERGASGTERKRAAPFSDGAAPSRERDENAASRDTRPSSASSDPGSPEEDRGRTDACSPTSPLSSDGAEDERSRDETKKKTVAAASEDTAVFFPPTRVALAEKRRVAFESGRALLDAHRMLVRASEAEAGALESAERALAAVERDAAEGGEGDDESAARDDFHAACDALAATLERRAALERRARRAAAHAHTARAEERAAADAAGLLQGGRSY